MTDNETKLEIVYKRRKAFQVLEDLLPILSTLFVVIIFGVSLYILTAIIHIQRGIDTQNSIKEQLLLTQKTIKDQQVKTLYNQDQFIILLHQVLQQQAEAKTNRTVDQIKIDSIISKLKHK